MVSYETPFMRRQNKGTPMTMSKRLAIDLSWHESLDTANGKACRTLHRDALQSHTSHSRSSVPTSVSEIGRLQGRIPTCRPISAIQKLVDFVEKDGATLVLSLIALMCWAVVEVALARAFFN